MKDTRSKYKYNDSNPTKPVAPKQGARAQKQFMLDWLHNNQEAFVEVMDQAKDQDPKLFATIYTTVMKHVVPQDKNVNVNVGINKDFLELQAMGKTMVQLPDNATTPSSLPHFTQYEEIVAEEHLPKENAFET